LTTLTKSVVVGRPSLARRLAWAARDTLVLTRRSLARIAREPETLSDVTIQPLVFVLLFSYVFGSAIRIPGGGNYHEYLLGGMIGIGLAGTAMGTAVGMASDMATGLIDRFRSLPMSRAAVLAGRTIADVGTQIIGLAVVVACGLAIGWRIHSGVGDALAAFGLALLFGYAMSWFGAFLGMLMRSAESAQQIGFVGFFPLMFVSNVFVPTQGMPGWLQAAADWNPISALAASCRHLFGNPDPAASIGAWPMQHPELAVLAWSAGMLAVFAPAAVALFRRKTRG